MKFDKYLKSWKSTFTIVVVGIILFVIDLSVLVDASFEHPQILIVALFLEIFIIVAFSIATMIRISDSME